VKLLLVRHAIAVPSGTAGIADDERPLTKRGRRRFRRAARGLARIVPPPDLLLTSPLPRARETAEITAAAWGGVTPTPEPLLAGAPPARLLAALAAHREKALVALVGHEPGISELLARLIGAAGERVPFKKGGAALIAMDEGGAGLGRLVWFLPPRLLRKLGRA
jgi:phosphohistidine phosphatase